MDDSESPRVENSGSPRVENNTSPRATEQLIVAYSLGVVASDVGPKHLMPPFRADVPKKIKESSHLIIHPRSDPDGSGNNIMPPRSGKISPTNIPQAVNL